MIAEEPFIFDLILKDTKISSWADFTTGNLTPNLSKPLTGSDYKIYIVTANKEVLYIGTTKSSLKSRLNSGLKANGKNGYHGYKWKNEKKIRIFVWNFTELDKYQTENIEAELAFNVRNKTGKWPKFQNEIHFNNSYEEKGKRIAKKMYEQIINCE